MKKVFLSVLVCSLLSVFVARGQSEIVKDINNYIWISNDYINCLKIKLPCECEKKVSSYFYLGLETDKKSKSFGVTALKYDSNEFEKFDIKEVTPYTYKVYNDIEDTSSFIGLIVVQKNILFFIDRENNKKIFKNYGKKYSNDESQHGNQNVKIINIAFVKRGYLPLERILDQDSLICSCNKELGRVNLIMLSGSKKAWIIEQKKDSVYLYHFINSSDDKIVPLIIKKELISKYKW